MLTVEEINNLTSEVNAFPGFAQNDYLVVKSFAEPVDTYTHYRRVVLLDALFSTNLRRGRPVGGLVRQTVFQISENIRNCLPQLSRIVAPIRESTLFELDFANQQVSESMSNALRAILDHLNNNALSFTGKYLHFLYPMVFPLWDRLVPQAINEIYDDEIFPENGANTPEYYLLLCQKYKEIAAHFSDTQLHGMIQQDHDSQPEGWRIQNTFVRILDKALWIYARPA